MVNVLVCGMPEILLYASAVCRFLYIIDSWLMLWKRCETLVFNFSCPGEAVSPARIQKRYLLVGYR